MLKSTLRGDQALCSLRLLEKYAPLCTCILNELADEAADQGLIRLAYIAGLFNGLLPRANPMDPHNDER